MQTLYFASDEPAWSGDIQESLRSAAGVERQDLGHRPYSFREMQKNALRSRFSQRLLHVETMCDSLQKLSQILNSAAAEFVFRSRMMQSGAV